MSDFTDVRLVSVLTGDIIGSTEMSPAQLVRVRDAVKLASDEFGDGRSVEITIPEFYRGDAWQLVVDDPRLGLRLALFIRARLRSTVGEDTRISIGIGGFSSIDTSQVSVSTGEAFVLSGRGLDAMTGYFDLTAALPARAGPASTWLQVILHLCSDMVRGWTRRQAEIVALALQFDKASHEQLAGRLVPAVKKQTVTASLSGANWRALQEALKAFESTKWLELMGESV